jgi:hypothetical protein
MPLPQACHYTNDSGTGVLLGSSCTLAEAGRNHDGAQNHTGAGWPRQNDSGILRGIGIVATCRDKFSR